MRWKFSYHLFATVIACGLCVTTLVHADDALAKASAAVNSILFGYDAEEFSSYSIDEDGSVEITFARNTPDALYSKILNKLQRDPDIHGVLAGKTGPICSSF